MKRMVTLVAGTLFLMGGAAWAWGPGKSAKGEDAGEWSAAQLERMTAALDLTDAQKTKIGALREAHWAEARQKRDAHQEEMSALREAHHDAVRGTLTAEQQKKFDAQGWGPRAERRKMDGTGPRGAGDATRPSKRGPRRGAD